ncbi:hypothetical protein [Ferrovibrio sp.]|uniref:hypothetical protein n=1 Tax=Ferrovibrio sp. TaxID=1917215 RepID=UPI0025BA7E47|nr:hypothetical protein [Ferrovibrio sp.]MBX3455034.1 hypothetical protein [Ferrovibrio sp.]
MVNSISAIIPPLAAERATLAAPVSPRAMSSFERIVGEAPAGAEIGLQDLLQASATIASQQSTEAADSQVGQSSFYNAPITYDGFGNGRRRSPTDMATLFISA